MFKKIIITTKHAGVRCNNGGEYEEWIKYEKKGNKYIVIYGTSAEFDSFCWKCRGYHTSTFDWERCKPSYLSWEEVVEELKSFKFLYVEKINKEGLWLDATGHLPAYCDCGAGCLICHPGTPHYPEDGVIHRDANEFTSF